MLLNLSPAFKDYLWGGNKLKSQFNKAYDGDILAEAWELSCHPDGPCIVENEGGVTLPEWLAAHGREALGTNCARFEDFPILIKLIDAQKKLSIQVHPDDAYAMAHEGGFGKTEVWYVVDCEPGASLYYGFRQPVTKEDFAAAIAQGTLTELLNQVLVRPGDVLFIEPGTIHAIGEGITVAEIQQNSNLTYRVFDYNRPDANGQLRPLHIEQALAVTNLNPPRDSYEFGTHVAQCEYFVVDHQSTETVLNNTVDEKSFHHLLIIGGSGTITTQGKTPESLPIQKGSSVMIPANSGDYQVTGAVELLLTRIP